MLFLLIVSILVITLWLIPYFIILWFLLTTTTYNYKISNKNTMIYHLAYLIIMLAFSFYVFCICYARVNETINIYDIWHSFSAIFGDCYYALPTLLFFSLLILLIFYVLIGVMIFKVITLYLKKSALSIYIYLLQYKLFAYFIFKYTSLHTTYILFLTKNINFQTNPWLYAIAHIIWPRSHYFLENVLYFGLLPSLLAYDCWFYHGQIVKFFMVLPWYYIYSIIRTSKYMFDEFLNDANIAMSREWYEKDKNFPLNKEKIKAFCFILGLIIFVALLYVLTLYIL